MKQHSHSLLRASACFVALAAAPVLTGCSGVVKNLNSAQVTVPDVNISNPFKVDPTNRAAALKVSSGPAPHVISARVVLKANVAAPNVNTYPFTQQSAGGLSADIAKRAGLSFNIDPTVTVDGATLPAMFTLQTITIVAEADDLDAPGGAVKDSVVLPPLTSDAPVVFTQAAAGGSAYNAAGSIGLSTGTITGAKLTSLFNIVTGESLNKQAVLTLTATSADLPDGSVVHITLGSSTLTIKAN